MPGGVADLERFYLFICARRGEATLCEDRPACLPDGSDAAPELVELGQGTAQLQVLLTLRRLLRSDLEPGTVDAGFIARYAGLLRRHPEVPEGLIQSPERHLTNLARRNLELMQQYLARTAG